MMPLLSFGAELEIRVIYDNTSAQAGVQEDWGYAALVDFRGHRILFDSGTKPDLFLANLRKLQIDPESIAQAVISHEHRDHRSGIYKLYPLHPRLTAFFLDRFPAEAFAEAQQVGMKPRRVTGPEQLAPGLWTTGAIEGDPPEQALVMETSKGVVLMTGCSHPGIVKIVETVKQQRGVESIRMLIGGFHLFRTGADQIEEIGKRLQALRVERIVPAHCTGDPAKERFAAMWKEKYGTAGAGKRLVLD